MELCDSQVTNMCWIFNLIWMYSRRPFYHSLFRIWGLLLSRTIWPFFFGGFMVCWLLVAAAFLDLFALLLGAAWLGEGLGCGFVALLMSSCSLLLMFLLPFFRFGGGPTAVLWLF